MLPCLTGLAQDQPSFDPTQLIQIAHQAIAREIQHWDPEQANQSQIPSRPVFVTIELGGRVVGCRGTLEVRKASLQQEVEEDARAACAHDPRYRPLSASDLPKILVTVTVIDRLQPVSSVDGLGPEDGLVLKADGKTGVVLPWEGKDPRTRLKWAYRKAGVAEGASATLFRMVARRDRG